MPNTTPASIEAPIHTITYAPPSPTLGVAPSGPGTSAAHAVAPKAEPVQQPALWFRNLVGAEAKPNGQCYDVVFLDPKDERYQPLYAAAIDAARAKQEESK